MINNRVVSVKEMRELDQLTIKKKGITSYQLMVQAGNAIGKHIMRRSLIQDASRVIILAGIGNNGGDALVVGNYFVSKKVDVTFVVVGNIMKQSNENKSQLDLVKKTSDVIYVESSEDIYKIKTILSKDTFIIDGLFGIGIDREVKGIYKEVINLVNGYAIISIDIASGINAENGLVSGVAIKANHTIVVQNYKYGNLLNDGLDYCGTLHLLDVGILQKKYPQHHNIMEEDILSSLHVRKRNTHKYHYGNILVIGGNKGMMGAPLLSSIAALRSGSGLVHLRYHESLLPHINNIYPDVMCGTYKDTLELIESFDKKNVIVFGPGLGRTAHFNKGNLVEILKTDKKLVIDADGLFYLKDVLDNFIERGNMVLTPHIKEFSVLTGYDIDEIQKNPIKLAKTFAHQYNVILVLKGVCTIITDGSNVTFSFGGNPGLAKAGTGDVLTGIIASQAGKGYSLYDSAKLGVDIHSKAANLAKDLYGEESMLASDLINFIPKVIKK